jgi:hypothetical protein
MDLFYVRQARPNAEHGLSRLYHIRPPPPHGAVGHVLHQPGQHGARRAAVPVPCAQLDRRVTRGRQQTRALGMPRLHVRAAAHACIFAASCVRFIVSAACVSCQGFDAQRNTNILSL